jgi:protein TonB
MFNTLIVSAEVQRRRGFALACGFVAEVLLIAAACLLAILSPMELPIAHRQYDVTWVPPVAPPEKLIVPAPQRVVQVVVPKPQLPETPPKLAAPKMAEVKISKPPKTVSATAEPPKPPPAQPIPPPHEQAEVRTGLFSGAPAPVTTKSPVDQVQTGGFGSLQGLPGQTKGDSPGNVAKLGSFELPSGPGLGNGTGGARGIQGVVASAGFGSAVAGRGDGRAGNYSKVAVGGFAKVESVAPTPGQTTQTPTRGVFQPVEIISKPDPIYTDEARRLGIQGEVALSVVFQASGTIRVVGVVKSLGHGLDQAAQEAAAQIRFKPAERDGKPADFPATLRIEFRLAGQPS